jgi:hypothetical protein
MKSLCFAVQSYQRLSRPGGASSRSSDLATAVLGTSEEANLLNGYQTKLSFSVTNF